MAHFSLCSFGLVRLRKGTAVGLHTHDHGSALSLHDSNDFLFLSSPKIANHIACPDFPPEFVFHFREKSDQRWSAASAPNEYGYLTPGHSEAMQLSSCLKSLCDREGWGS